MYYANRYKVLLCWNDPESVAHMYLCVHLVFYSNRTKIYYNGILASTVLILMYEYLIHLTYHPISAHPRAQWCNASNYPPPTTATVKISGTISRIYYYICKLDTNLHLRDINTMG